MKILALNTGSSSLKFALFEMPSGRRRLEGSLNQPTAMVEAVHKVGAFLTANGEDRFDAVGHRVAHGGAKYGRPVLLNGAAEQEEKNPEQMFIGMDDDSADEHEQNASGEEQV